MLNTMKTKRMDLLLILVLAMTGVPMISAQLIISPSNAAAIVGDSVVFNCTSNSVSSLPSWFFRANTSTVPTTPIAENCVVVSADPTVFVTETSGSGSCNLIIPSVSFQLAGIYRCTQGGGDEGSAFLAVTASDAGFVSNATDAEIGDVIDVTCSVSYNSNSEMPPSLLWMNDETGENLTSVALPPSPPSLVVSSFVQVTIETSQFPNISCAIFFNPPQYENVLFAKNAPEFSHSWKSSAIVEILYLSTATTNFTGACLPVGEEFILICSAPGNPSATYEWTELNSSRIESNTPTVTISSDGRYQCTAFNDIRQRRHNTSSEIIEITTCVETDLQPTSFCSDLFCQILFPIAIYEAVNIIALIVFLVYYRPTKTTSKQKERKTGHWKLNDRFPILQDMLPCMNEGCDCSLSCSLWLFCFVLMTIFGGLFIFPSMIIVVNCCSCCQTKDSNTDGFNYDQNTRNDIVLASSNQTNDSSSPYRYQGNETSRYNNNNNNGFAADAASEYSSQGPYSPCRDNSQYKINNNYSRSPSYHGGVGISSSPTTTSMHQRPPYQMPAPSYPPPPPPPFRYSLQSTNDGDSVVYVDLKVDSLPRSRRPVQLTGGEGELEGEGDVAGPGQEAGRRGGGRRDANESATYSHISRA